MQGVVCKQCCALMHVYLNCVPEEILRQQGVSGTRVDAVRFRRVHLRFRAKQHLHCLEMLMNGCPHSCACKS